MSSHTSSGLLVHSHVIQHRTFRHRVIQDQIEMGTVWILPQVPRLLEGKPGVEVLSEVLRWFAVEVGELHCQVLMSEGSAQVIGAYVAQY